MGRDYRNFLRILLTEEPGEPTLFEPFIDNMIAEQLIWRRGEHLWNTPALYIDTLVSLNERTVSDVIIADSRLFETDLPEFYRAVSDYADDRIRFVALCGSEESARMADRCSGVCAVGIYGSTASEKPVIRMDGTPEEAIATGCVGWFAPYDAER